MPIYRLFLLAFSLNYYRVLPLISIFYFFREASIRVFFQGSFKFFGHLVA